MRVRKVFFFFTISLVLLAVQAHIGWTGRAEIEKQSALTVTESLRVMGKGVDHIVVGEETLYVVPAITKITSSSGNAMDLKRLRTPCLADVTYARWWKGTDKLPVVLHLKVKRVYRGASSDESRE
jgi:hypothetical protein